MRGCLSSADDPADFFGAIGIGLRPCVNNENDDSSNQAHRLPSVAVGMRVLSRKREGVVKNELGRFETNTMGALVGYDRSAWRLTMFYRIK